MVDFSSLLKDTLAAVNKVFKEADSDLSDIASRISSAIKTNVGEQFDIVKSEIKNTIDGVVYRFYFDTNVLDERAEAITLCFIHIPVTGYPIFSGNYTYKDRTFVAKGKYDNKKDLEEYFEKFFEDPESSLIQAIGFALRMGKKI